jgi:hypothetical protein
MVLSHQVQDVGELLNATHQKEKKTNRAMFMKVLRCIRFLARQGIALRGDGSEPDGNFMQLLQLMCVDSHELRMWLNKKTNKYTSHDIHNET